MQLRRVVEVEGDLQDLADLGDEAGLLFQFAPGGGPYTSSPASTNPAGTDHSPA